MGRGSRGSRITKCDLFSVLLSYENHSDATTMTHVEGDSTGAWPCPTGHNMAIWLYMASNITNDDFAERSQPNLPLIPRLVSVLLLYSRSTGVHVVSRFTWGDFTLTRLQCLMTLRIADAFECPGQPPKIVLSRWRSAPPHLIHGSLSPAEIACVVPEISSRTDRQTDRQRDGHTHIAVLLHRSRRRSNNAQIIYGRPR